MSSFCVLQFAGEFRESPKLRVLFCCSYNLSYCRTDHSFLNLFFFTAFRHINYLFLFSNNFPFSIRVLRWLKNASLVFDPFIYLRTSLYITIYYSVINSYERCGNHNIITLILSLQKRILRIYFICHIFSSSQSLETKPISAKCKRVKKTQPPRTRADTQKILYTLAEKGLITWNCNHIIAHYILN